MTEHIPELGQIVFGQPHQEFDVPMIMEAAIFRIRDVLDTVMWNINQKEYDSPFSNSGNSFKNETFEAVAYSWGDDEQAYNFAWKDLRISWYKWAGRGMSSNILITPELAAACLEDCVASLHRMDEENDRATNQAETQ